METEAARPEAGPMTLDAAVALPALFRALTDAGYRIIGPTVRDNAIVLDELRGPDELPHGVGVELEAGQYRLRDLPDQSVFNHAAGPRSWKDYLHPPREKLWSGRRTEAGFEVDRQPAETPRYAFVGVRPCDLRAIAIQDKVLAGGGHVDTAYGRRRAAAFIVAVNCVEPGATCFCASMNAGPGADGGYDLLLTEQAEQAGGTGASDAPAGHTFVARAGSPAGERVLAALAPRPATAAETARAEAQVAAAADRMGRTMPPVDLRALLADNPEAERWNDVAARCLACGNCTMVCPTCFCVTSEDVSDLTGEHAERWQLWDSCFDIDYSYLHGGSVRTSTLSRYRQWMTHKLSTWHDQFGTTGCVGCGRCLVWCPVGIDITEEAHAIHQETGARDTEGGARSDRGES